MPSYSIKAIKSNPLTFIVLFIFPGVHSSSRRGGFIILLHFNFAIEILEQDALPDLALVPLALLVTVVGGGGGLHDDLAVERVAGALDGHALDGARDKVQGSGRRHLVVPDDVAALVVDPLDECWAILAYNKKVGLLSRLVCCMFRRQTACYKNINWQQKYYNNSNAKKSTAGCGSTLTFKIVDLAFKFKKKTVEFKYTN